MLKQRLYKAIVVFQSLIIVGLLNWLLIESQSNPFMGLWFSQNFPIGTVLLKGPVVIGFSVLLLGSVTIWLRSGWKKRILVRGKLILGLPQTSSGPTLDEESLTAGQRDSGRRPRSTLLRLLYYLRPNWAYSVATGLVIVTTTALDLVQPWVMGFLLVGEVIVGKNLTLLPLVVTLLASAYIAKQATGYLQAYLTAVLGQRILHALRYDLYTNLEHLRVRFFDDNRAGDLVSRVISDTEEVENMITGLSGLGADVVKVAGIFVLIFYVNLGLALFVVPLAATLPLVVILFKKTIKRSSRRIRDAVGDLAAKVDETVSGIRIVKSFSMEQHEASKFHSKSSGILRSKVKLVNLSQIYSTTLDLIAVLAVLLVISAGAPSVVSGTLTLGALIAFLGFVNQLFNPIINLSKANFTFQKANAAGERIFEIMDSESETPEILENADPAEFSPAKGEIEFNRVSFSYDPTRMVLDDLNMKVQAGETLAIVGRSGVGKSTMVNLLLRFYEPTSGRIIIDGLPINEMNLTSLRGKIAVVLQEPILFTGSVRDNVAYGKINATDSEIVDATKAANAHDFVMALQNGYNTQIGERGIKLSGGEKQRIALARALLKNPSILILDEATSNVDAESEALIQQALKRLAKGRTTIIIAHRLSTIMDADKIVVIDDGGIVEIGTHEELIAKGGVYTRLYEAQLKLQGRDPAALLF